MFFSQLNHMSTILDYFHNRLRTNMRALPPTACTAWSCFASIDGGVDEDKVQGSEAREGRDVDLEIQAARADPGGSEGRREPQTWGLLWPSAWRLWWSQLKLGYLVWKKKEQRLQECHILDY